jgi:hypothetical protein
MRPKEVIQAVGLAVYLGVKLGAEIFRWLYLDPHGREAYRKELERSMAEGKYGVTRQVAVRIWHWLSMPLLGVCFLIVALGTWFSGCGQRVPGGRLSMTPEMPEPWNWGYGFVLCGEAKDLTLYLPFPHYQGKPIQEAAKNRSRLTRWYDQGPVHFIEEVSYSLIETQYGTMLKLHIPEIQGHYAGENPRGAVSVEGDGSADVPVALEPRFKVGTNERAGLPVRRAFATIARWGWYERDTESCIYVESAELKELYVSVHFSIGGVLDDQLRNFNCEVMDEDWLEKRHSRDAPWGIEIHGNGWHRVPCKERLTMF